MNKRKLFILITLYIIFQIANNLSIEELTESGVKGHIILIGRSMVCLLISVLVAVSNKKSIFPQKIQTQVVRILLSGIGLLLITQSYQYLSATSVTTFQRLDITFILIISMVIGRYKSYDKILFILANILTIASLLTLSNSIEEDPLGYFLVLLGVLLISISTFFVKRTALEENFFVFVNTACISCIIVGFSFGLYKGFETVITYKTIIGLTLSGIFMFGLYFCLMEFYKFFSIEKAQYPAVIAAFLMLFIEMLIEQKWFNPLFILLNLLLLTIITLTIRHKNIYVDRQE